jgi:trigger factor
MQADVHSLESFTQRISFSFTGAEVSKAFTGELNKLAARVNIPGFRKGKVPPKVMRQRFGQGALMEAQQALVQQAWTHMLTALKMKPMSSPTLGELKELASETSGLSFSFSFDVLPPFELIDPKSFELSRTQWSASEAAVTQRLNKMCEQAGEWVSLKRRKKARAGDMMTFSLKGSVAGASIALLNSEREQVVLGSQSIIPALEDALIGAKVSDEVKVSYTFDDTHPNSELKGKQVDFECKVIDVQQREPLTPEALAEKLKLEGVDAVRAKISEELSAEKSRAEGQRLRNDLVTQLRARYDFPIPPTALAEQASHRLHSGHSHAHGEDCDHSPEDEARAREEAAADIRLEAVLARVAESEGVQVSDREVQDRLFEMVRTSGEFGWQLFQFYNEPKNRERLKASLQEDKALDKIIELASVSVVQAEIEPIAEDAAADEE